MSTVTTTTTAIATATAASVAIHTTLASPSRVTLLRAIASVAGRT